ncbi:MAG: hypothetical protein QME74_01805 [Candidatus Edwardsbacteria bacterium]|nr:hypothetical protein [Candidatus Edwardsbacteria bacterium]
MARKIERKSSREKPGKKTVVPETPIGFDKKNYILFGAGIGLIVLGSLFLTSPSFGGAFPFIHPFSAGANGFLTMNVAPVMLVLGYCVAIPWAIIGKSK